MFGVSADEVVWVTEMVVVAILSYGINILKPPIKTTQLQVDLRLPGPRLSLGLGLGFWHLRQQEARRAQQGLSLFFVPPAGLRP